MIAICNGKRFIIKIKGFTHILLASINPNKKNITDKKGIFPDFIIRKYYTASIREGYFSFTQVSKAKHNCPSSI